MVASDPWLQTATDAAKSAGEQASAVNPVLSPTVGSLLAAAASGPLLAPATAVLPVVLDVLPRIVSVAAAVGVGLFLANLAVAFGAVRAVAGLAKPLTAPANLPPAVGTAILATTASPTAGYGMLAEFRDDGVLDDTATLVAITMNTFFGFVQHIFTYYAPVLIPILGFRVGLMYVGARAGVSLAITLTGILAGAVLLSNRNVNAPADASVDEPGTDEPGTDDRTREEKLRDALDSTWEKLVRIVPRLAVIYVIVALLLANYDLTTLGGSGPASDPVAALTGLPAASLPVIAIFAVDTTSGALAIAPLVGEVFTPEQAVATMLVGGIVSFAFSTFKRSIPFQYGIWGASFGTKVIVVNTVLKVAWLGVAIGLLLWW